MFFKRHRQCIRFTKIAVVLGILIGLGSSANAATVFVDKDSPETPDGLTWATAYTTIQAGIDAASSNDEIWVSEGTYPEAITLKTDIGVYGGFTGLETLLAQRDATTNVVIIDATGLTTSVVTMDGSSVVIVNTTFDGFTATGGTGTSGFGGGMNVLAVDASNTVSNCIFKNNKVDPSITPLYGGGMHIGSGSTLLVSHCTFTGNKGTQAGGILCASASPTISNCILTSNRVANTGGGVQIYGTSTPVFNDCIISGNDSYSVQSGSGGGLAINGVPGDATAPVFNRCTISGNTTKNYGGGIWSRRAAVTLNNCNLIGNYTWGYGGAIFAEEVTLTLTNCTLSSNVCVDFGGGIFLDTTAPTLTNCIFSSNDSHAVYEEDVACDSVLTNCLFYNNRVFTSTLGDYYDFETGSLIGATAINALADVSNTNNIDGDPVFETDMVGTWTGFVVYDSVTQTTTFTNASATYEVDELVGKHILTNTAKLRESYIVSNTATTITTGGILPHNSNPSNANYIIKDYHLQSTSPAKDAGTATGAPDTDIDGEARPFDGTDDIGADEWFDTDGDGDSDHIDTDDDDDGMPDAWENDHGLNSLIDDTALDLDSDGLTNWEEYQLGTHPNKSDTDGDGLSDDEEVNNYLTDPTLWDTDEDGFSDGDEIDAGSDPNEITSLPPTELWLDFGWAGTKTGTLEEPFSILNTILNKAWFSGTIYINGGSASTTTNWTGTLDKPMTLDTYGGSASIGN